MVVDSISQNDANYKATQESCKLDGMAGNLTEKFWNAIKGEVRDQCFYRLAIQTKDLRFCSSAGKFTRNCDPEVPQGFSSRGEDLCAEARRSPTREGKNIRLGSEMVLIDAARGAGCIIVYRSKGIAQCHSILYEPRHDRTN